MGDAMRGFLRETGLGEQLRHAGVYRAWSDALGPKLSQRAKPVFYKFGELTVEVESAAHLHELQNFTGEQYRREANESLGEERIKKIQFRLKR
ncbi:MAG: hypothetical protein ACI8X5_003447 [Planctomycetota bacterium]|jgi:hypothetical protein